MKQLENAIIGALINDIDVEQPSLFYIVNDILNGTEFSDVQNLHIYKNIKILMSSVDASSYRLVEVLNADKDFVFDYEHFAKVIYAPAGAFQIEAFCYKLKEKAILKSVCDTATALQVEAMKPGADALEVLAKAEALLTGGAAQINSKEETNAEAAAAVFGKAYDAAKGKTSSAVTWPLKELNAITGGMQGGDFIVLAARPGRGKTALAVQTALHNVNKGLKVCFVSVEMTKRKLMQRIIKPKGIAENDINTGNLTAAQLEQLSANATAAAEKLKNLFILSDNVSNVETLVSKVKGLHAREKFDFLIVDYLQLINADGSAYERVTNVSMRLTNLAKDLKTPLLCLAQLNRAVDNRPDQKAVLSDLRDSGQIEQDAAQVLFINPDPMEPEDRAKCCITVEKNRNGRTGYLDLYYEGINYTFKEVTF